MSNPYVVIPLLMKTVFPGTSNLPTIGAYVDFRNEVRGTSTQCTAWTTATQQESGTPPGSQGNITSGPTITWAAGSDGTAERTRAAIGLADQLIASLPAGTTWPKSFGFGGDHNQ